MRDGKLNAEREAFHLKVSDMQKDNELMLEQVNQMREQSQLVEADNQRLCQELESARRDIEALNADLIEADHKAMTVENLHEQAQLRVKSLEQQLSACQSRLATETQQSKRAKNLERLVQ